MHISNNNIVYIISWRLGIVTKFCGASRRWHNVHYIHFIIIIILQYIAPVRRHLHCNINVCICFQNNKIKFHPPQIKHRGIRSISSHIYGDFSLRNGWVRYLKVININLKVSTLMIIFGAIFGLWLITATEWESNTSRKITIYQGRTTYLSN